MQERVPRAIIVISVLIVVLAVATPLVFQTWLMPGQLSAAHATYERDCANCHLPWQEPTAARCLICHQDVAQASSGVHAGEIERCQECHTEHRGRAHALAALDTAYFDHDATGFSLGRFHQGLACEKCHPVKGDYRGLSPDCSTCHPDWQHGVFDHSVTGWPLASYHQNVPCERCHAGGRAYDQAPRDCAQCHGPWDASNFDHEKMTGWPLAINHQNLPCERCHGEEGDYGGLKAQCSACHPAWTGQTFDHLRWTGFDLGSYHRSLECSRCHESEDYRGLSRDCATCHG